MKWTPKSPKQRGKRARLGIESLEQRFLLAGTNLIAQYDGAIAARHGEQVFHLSINSPTFNLAGATTLLAFQLTDALGSRVDPDAVEIRRSDMSIVTPAYAVADLSDDNDSLVLAALPAGEYTLVARGQGIGIGGIQLDVSLAGDVDGNRIVDRADAARFVGAFGSTAASDSYRLEADADMDGTVALADLAYLQGNLEDMALLSPLFLSAELTPAPGFSDDGRFVLTTGAVEVVGDAGADAAISLDADGDGFFDDGADVGGAEGEFSIPLTLAPGENRLLLRAVDAVGQQRLFEIVVTLFDSGPEAPAFDLRPDSDTGAVGDQVTTRGYVALSGTTDPGARVSLDGTEWSTWVDDNGMFTFEDVHLTLGDNPFTARAIDAAGQESVYDLTLTRILPAEIDAPRVDLDLIIDAGPFDNDHVSNVDDVIGAVADASTIIRLSAGFGDDPATYSDIIEFMGDFNVFVLTHNQLEALLGRPITDGNYELNVIAEDEWGSVGTGRLEYTLDTAPPAEPVYFLDPAFDTGEIGDHATDLPLVRLHGFAQPGTRILLEHRENEVVVGDNGSFAFDNVPLVYELTLQWLRATDLAGNTTGWWDAFYREPPVEDVTAPDLEMHLIGVAGAGVNATVTNAPAIRGSALDQSGLARLEAVFDTSLSQTPTDILADIAPDYSFTLDAARMEEIFGEPLPEGMHTLRLEAEDTLGQISERTFTFRVDRTPPKLNVLAPWNGTVVRYGSRLHGNADDVDSDLTAVEYRWDGQPPLSLDVPSAGGSFSTFLLSNNPFLPHLFFDVAPGMHELTVLARDRAGNEATRTMKVEVEEGQWDELFVTALWPLDGAIDVPDSAAAEVHFSRPVNAASLTTANFFARHDGQPLAGQIVPSVDGLSARWVPDAPLPGGANIEFTLAGDSIRTPELVQLNAGVGFPNLFRFGFQTAATLSVAGTSLSGRVVDPGPDLIPGTGDDVLPGGDELLGTEDDVYLLPIENVAVYVSGQPAPAAFTDSQGLFHISAVPVGAVPLRFDATAASPPDNYFFYGAFFTAETIEDDANLVNESGAIYLARLSTGIRTYIDATINTTLGIVPEAAGGLSIEDQQKVRVNFPPGSLLAADGTPTVDGWVGISVVPNEIVRATLPLGVTQDSFVFTIETEGFDRLATTASIMLPNVHRAAPGTELVWLAQDASGAWRSNGTFTVSADGETMTSNSAVGNPDEESIGGAAGAPAAGGAPRPALGAGVGGGGGGGGNAIGPPGGGAGPNPNPPPPPKPELDGSCFPGDAQVRGRPPQLPGGNPGVRTDIETWGPDGRKSNAGGNHLWVSDEGGIQLTFTAQSYDSRCFKNDEVIKLRVEWDAKEYKEFFTGTLDGKTSPWEINLGQGGSGVRIKLTLKPLIPGIKKKGFDPDRLYGMRLATTTYKSSEPKPPSSLTSGYHLYRWLDTSDLEHKDGIVSMPRTAPNMSHTRNVEVKYPSGMEPLFENEQGATGSFSAPFDSASGRFVFSPPSEDYQGLVGAMQGDGMQVKFRVLTKGKAPVTVHAPKHGAKKEFPDGLLIEGDARTQRYSLNGAAFVNEAQRLAHLNNPQITAAEKANVGNPATMLLAGLKLNELLGVAGEAVIVGPTGGVQVTTYRWSGGASPDAPSSNQPAPAAAAAICPTSTERAPSTPDAQTIGYAPDSDRLEQGQIRELLVNITNENWEAWAYRMSRCTNRRYTGSVEIYLNSMLALPPPGFNFDDPAYLANEIAGVLAHEFGHQIGLSHTLTFPTIGGVKVERHIANEQPALPDVMAHGYNFYGNRRFNITGSTLRLAVGARWTMADVVPIYTYLYNYLTRPDARSWGQTVDEGDGDLYVDPDFVLGPFAGLMDSPIDGADLLAAVDFGDVIHQPTGGVAAARTVYLRNFGDQTLKMTNLSVTGEGWRVSPIALPLHLAPGEAFPIEIELVAGTTGIHQGTIVLDTDSFDGPTTVTLAAQVISPVGDVQVEVPNNNLGGLAIGAAAQSASDFAIISNAGLSPLSITRVYISGGGGQFAATRLPISLASGSPHVLAPGESLPISLAFDPSAIGLQRAELVIESNDLDTPVMRTTIVGTGLGDGASALALGRDYVTLHAFGMEDEPTYHLRSDNKGHWTVYLPPDVGFNFVTFDPVSGLVAHGGSVMGESASPAFDGSTFDASTEPDSDGDGLPDDIEFAVGSDPALTDSDNDGVTDFDEVITPVMSPPPPVNPLLPLVYGGTTFALRATVVGSPQTGAPQYAYVGIYDGDIGVVDVTNPAVPQNLGRIDLTGNVIGVDADPAANRLVAASSEGLHVLDISNRARPTLVRTINVGPGGAQWVALRDNVAYAVTGRFPEGFFLKQVDLATNTVTQSIQVGSPGTDEFITGFDVEGNFLYTMTRFQNRLRIFDISGPQIVQRGSLVTLGGSAGLSVEGDVAYVGNAYRLDNLLAEGHGYSTVNVSNPDQPTLIASLIDGATRIPSRAIAATSSGLALMAGSLTTGTPFSGMWVVDISNPAQMTPIRSIATSAAPQYVSVAAGLALLPLLTNGILMIDFAGPDAAGTAPTATIATDAVDVDPARPGVQILEGTVVHVTALPDDDVQVRHVDLLVNGVAVERDLETSFDRFTVVAPPSGPVPPQWTLTARAADLAGRTGTSAPAVFEVLPIAPRVIATLPGPGAATRDLIETINVTFSEALATGAIAAVDFGLLAAGLDGALGTADDVAVAFSSLAFSADRRKATLGLPAPLASGLYRLSIEDDAVRDLAGNLLDGESTGSLPSGNGAGGGNYVATFTILPPPGMPGGLFPGEFFEQFPRGAWDIDNHAQALGAVHVADVNGDGLPDAVQLTTIGADDGHVDGAFVSVLLGTASGGFGRPILSRVDDAAASMALGDVDEDGDVDAVVSSRGAGLGTLDVLLGNGAGEFDVGQQLGASFAQSAAGDLALVDVTGEGIVDVVALIPSGTVTSLRVYLGLGFGEFAPPATMALVGGLGDTRLWASDLDGDTFVDLVTDRRVLMNQCDGTFHVAPLVLAAGARVRAVDDFGGDGHDDLLVLRNVGAAIVATIHVNNGAGAFAPGADTPLGTVALGEYLDTADLGGDGRADLVAATQPGSTATPGELLVVSANAIGGLNAPQRMPLAWKPSGVALAQLPGDAHWDVLTGVQPIVNVAALALLSGAPGGGFHVPRHDATIIDSITVADVTGDSLPDRVGYDNALTAFALLMQRGRGDGTFDPAVTLLSWGSLLANPEPPVVADVNGDLKPDIVAATGGGGISLFRGRGDGAFDPPTSSGTAPVGTTYALVDMNLDGRLDIVTNGAVGLQNASGAFVATPTPPETTGLGAGSVADVNGDGRPDIIRAHATTAVVALNQPGMTFSIVYSLDVLSGATPARVSAGDVNGDGRADLAIVGLDGSVQLLIARADGTLSAGTLPVDYETTDARMGDVNGDGLVDLVFARASEVGVLLGNGDGTFARRSHRFIARASRRVQLADVNGDGLVDLLAAAVVLRRRG